MVGLDGQFCVTGAPGMRPKCDCVQKKKGNSISLSHLFISVKIDIHIYTESERASERVCVCVCVHSRARVIARAVCLGRISIFAAFAREVRDAPI